LRHYKPRGNQPFGLGEHNANGVFYSFDTDSDPDPDIDSDYHSFTVVDFIVGFLELYGVPNNIFKNFQSNVVRYLL
jgi:hypothetical protein